jgi:hypothetical protein
MAVRLRVVCLIGRRLITKVDGKSCVSVELLGSFSTHLFDCVEPPWESDYFSRSTAISVSSCCINDYSLDCLYLEGDSYARGCDTIYLIPKLLREVEERVTALFPSWRALEEDADSFPRFVLVW